FYHLKIQDFYLKLKKSRISNKGTKLSRLIFLFPKRVSIIENSLYRKNNIWENNFSKYAGSIALCDNWFT
ncbi:hypothetical protein BpHYR1_025104, partial [Brachionus plicatilis]